MVQFKINLIRDEVISLPRRRFLYMALSVYVTLCIGLFIAACYDATNKVIKAVRVQRDIDALQAEFRALHPGEDDLVAFAEQVSEGLERHAGMLGTINNLLGTRPDMARILAGLSQPLPEGVYIQELAADTRGHRLTFSVIATDKATVTNVSVEAMTELWMAEPHLTGRVQDIRINGTREERMATTTANVWEFSGRLGPGGG